MERKILVGIPTQEYARRADFYDYLHILNRSVDTLIFITHDRSPANGRNIMVEEARRNNCTHICFIDDDMAFKPDTLDLLLKHDVDVVSGLYFSRSFPHQPLIFDSFDEEGHAFFHYLDDSKSSGLIPIAAAGLGFCLIKLSVFDKLIKPYFRLGELDPEQWCDDIGFFFRLNKLGIKCYCDLDCKVGHIGTMVVWPNYNDGKWMTGYDTNGKMLVNVPR